MEHINTEIRTMSFADTLLQQTPVMAVSFTQLLVSMAELVLLGGVLMFFRPLLVGVARALVLVVRPRPTKDELAARRKLRDAKAALQVAAVAPAERAKLHVLGSR
jgi:hypothetical protein